MSRMDYYAAWLAHHGIKGQKWGVRRFQNEDGSLTSRGKQRYEEPSQSKRSSENKESSASYRSAPSPKKSIEDDPEVQSVERSHRAKLIAKHMAEGMSREEAAAKAESRIRMEKRIAIGLGAAAAVGIIVGAARINYNKQYAEAAAGLVDKNKIDEFVKFASDKGSSSASKLKAVFDQNVNSPKIKLAAQQGIDYINDRNLDLSGTPLHRITRNSDFENSVGKAFYAAYDETDRLKYRGMYGKQLLQGGAKKIYDIAIEPKGPIKVAGDKTAMRVLMDQISNDKTSRDYLEWQANKLSGNFMLRFISPKVAAMADSAAFAFKNNPGGAFTPGSKESEAVYNLFNYQLVDHSPSSKQVTDRFYNSIKSLGYHAIQDVNDRTFSGYNAKDALIVIDPESVVAKVSGRALSIDEISKDADRAMRMLNLR